MDNQKVLELNKKVMVDRLHRMEEFDSVTSFFASAVVMNLNFTYIGDDLVLLELRYDANVLGV